MPNWMVPVPRCRFCCLIGYKGYPQKVSVLNGQVESFETTLCLGEFGWKKLQHLGIYNTQTGNMNIIDWNVCAKEWPHLQGLRFHHLGPRPIVDNLIGLDMPYSIKDISGKPGQTIARLTPLGWTCVGALSGSLTHFARTYFTLDQTITENFDVALRKFWEIDSSGMGNLPMLSVNDKMAIEKVES